MSDLGQQLVNEAKTQVGKPYVWGAEGPSGYDCSGLVVWALSKVGISSGIPRTSQAMRNIGTSVPLSQIQVGDLVTFTYADRRGDNPGPGNHVAIYARSGQVVQASGNRVNVSALDPGPVDPVIRLPQIGGQGSSVGGSGSGSSTSTASPATPTPASAQAMAGVTQADADVFGIPINPFDWPGWFLSQSGGGVPWDALGKVALAGLFVAGGVALVVGGGIAAIWPTAQKGLDTADKINAAIPKGGS